MARRNSLLVSKTLYQIGVVTLIVALIWVMTGIYSALNEPVSAEVDKKILEPINPVIDQEVIKALSRRLVIENPLPSEPSESATPDPSANIDEGNTQ